MNDITLLTNKFIKEVYNISKVNSYKIKCNKEILEELQTIIDVCSSWQYEEKEKCKYCYKYSCDNCKFI